MISPEDYIGSLEDKSHSNLLSKPDASVAESNINELLDHIDKLHTTALGILRIKENLTLEVDDVVEWCQNKILQSNASIVKKGKNWYVTVDGCEVTVNARSYTIITAHKKKSGK